MPSASINIAIFFHFPILRFAVEQKALLFSGVCESGMVGLTRSFHFANFNPKMKARFCSDFHWRVMHLFCALLSGYAHNSEHVMK